MAASLSGRYGGWGVAASALLLSLAACDGAPTIAQSLVQERETAAALPTLSGRVVDQANLLSDEVERELTERQAELERKTTDQLVVVTVPALGSETIEQLGLRLGKGWGVGRADKDNGVLLIIAPNDRKVRIEVGLGLEGLLTDARAQHIIDRELLPQFRAGRYEQGAARGVAAISAVLEEDSKRPMLKAGAL